MPKRLKKIILAIFAALFITLPFISAFAHPGRTDANGGHWNHDTGEYHYHNGEYAGQSNGSSSSSSKYDDFTPDEYKAIGLKDGLQQLYIDTIYSSAYKDGYFSEALIYCFKHPLFFFVKVFDNRSIFHDTLSFSDSYISTRKNHYDEHGLKWISGGYSAYIEGYDYSYKYGNFNNASTTYKTSTKAEYVKTQGKIEGRTQFKDVDLQNYIDRYPFEAFFTTTYFFYVVACIIIPLTIVTSKIKKARKEKESAILDAKNNNQKKNNSVVEQTTQKTPHQKAEKQNQDNVVYVNYKREYIYDTMLKSQKNPTYVIGKDIPSGNFVFSTSSEQNKFAFVRIYPADGSEHRDVRIYGNEQTVALAYGETIELCNCRITDSPKIIHPQEKPIVYIVGENIEKGVYTVFRHQPKDGLVKVYEDNKHTKSILIDCAKNVKFKNGMELRLYNCDIKR